MFSGSVNSLCRITFISKREMVKLTQKILLEIKLKRSNCFVSWTLEQQRREKKNCFYQTYKRMLISVRPWQLFLENKSQLRSDDFSTVRFTYQHINNVLGLDWDFQTSHKAQGCGLHPCRSSSKKSSGYESSQFPSGFWETVICSCVIPPINYFFYPFLPLGWMLWSESSKNGATHLSTVFFLSQSIFNWLLQEVL